MTSVTCYGQVIEVNHRYPMDLSLFYIISDIKLTSKKNTKLDISRYRIQCYINKVRMKITSGRIRIQMFQADDRLIKKARGTDKLKKIAVIHDLVRNGKMFPDSGNTGDFCYGSAGLSIAYSSSEQPDRIRFLFLG